MPSAGSGAADSIAWNVAPSAPVAQEVTTAEAAEAKLEAAQTVSMAMAEAAAEAIETPTALVPVAAPQPDAEAALVAQFADTTAEVVPAAAAAAEVSAAPMPSASEVQLTRRAATARRRASRADQRLARLAQTPRPARKALAPAPAAASAPRKQPSGRARAVLRKVYSGAALLFAGALLVGTTVPANAFRSESFTDAAVSAAVKPAAQQLAVEADSVETVAAQSARDDYTVTTRAQVLRQTYGTRSYDYVSTGTGAIRWPFPYTVPVSSGFGDRAAPCRGCSTNHRGLDLTPGAGTPIYSIADGIVTEVSSSGGFGHHVYIQHEINGQTVVSVYAHMQWDSSPLVVGEQIAVGEFVGLVGSTGQSTGPHLHLEIIVNGSHVDPYSWLTANAS